MKCGCRDGVVATCARIRNRPRATGRERAHGGGKGATRGGARSSANGLSWDCAYHCIGKGRCVDTSSRNDFLQGMSYDARKQPNWPQSWHRGCVKCQRRTKDHSNPSGEVHVILMHRFPHWLRMQNRPVSPRFSLFFHGPCPLLTLEHLTACDWRKGKSRTFLAWERSPIRASPAARRKMLTVRWRITHAVDLIEVQTCWWWHASEKMDNGGSVVGAEIPVPHGLVASADSRSWKQLACHIT